MVIFFYFSMGAWAPVPWTQWHNGHSRPANNTPIMYDLTSSYNNAKLLAKLLLTRLSERELSHGDRYRTPTVALQRCGKLIQLAKLERSVSQYAIASATVAGATNKADTARRRVDACVY